MKKPRLSHSSLSVRRFNTSVKIYLKKQFVTYLSSVLAICLETFAILSGASEAKTPSTSLELTQLQTFTGSPQKSHWYGQSIKVCDNPQTMHFFPLLAAMFCSKRLTTRPATYGVLYVHSSPPLGGDVLKRGKTNGQTTLRESVQYIHTFSADFHVFFQWDNESFSMEKKNDENFLMWMMK